MWKQGAEKNRTQPIVVRLTWRDGDMDGQTTREPMPPTDKTGQAAISRLPVGRTWRGHAKIDANDPKQTQAVSQSPLSVSRPTEPPTPTWSAISGRFRSFI